MKNIVFTLLITIAFLGGCVQSGKEKEEGSVLPAHVEVECDKCDKVGNCTGCKPKGAAGVIKPLHHLMSCESCDAKWNCKGCKEIAH